MLRRPAITRGLLLSLGLFFSTALWGSLVSLAGIFKLLVPTERGRRRLLLVMASLADRWALTNNALFRSLLTTRFRIDVPPGLRCDGRYLVVSNHRAWGDIFIVFLALGGRIPFIRFFMKRILIWVPFAGIACWLFEFPFVKRYSPEYLEKHPEERGRDLDITRRACRRLQSVPFTILSFAEGTRFTRKKHAKQASPYAKLLHPRIGGIAQVFGTLGPLIDDVLDVTIVYGSRRSTLLDLVFDRIPSVDVSVRMVAPPDIAGDPTQPGEARERLRGWIDGLWAEKDEKLQEMTAR